MKEVIRRSIEIPEKQYYVIVPEQFSLEMQRKIVKMHPRHGFFNIDVLSFHRLSYRIFAECNYQPKEILEDLGVSMMLRKILSEEERLKGVQKALCVIPERVEYFAEMMNVTYGRITIREQKTRWGSCSSKGNLNFNWKLVLMPEEVLDYVVVHELAHRKEMNHSERFWNHVEKVLPDYQARRKLLRELEHRHL